MDTIDVFQKVTKLENKGHFDRYEVRNMPKFETMSELKTFCVGELQRRDLFCDEQQEG